MQTLMQFGLVMIGVAMIFVTGFVAGRSWQRGHDMRVLSRSLGQGSEPEETEPWVSAPVGGWAKTAPDPNVMGMGDFVPDPPSPLFDGSIPEGPTPATLAMMRAIEQTQLGVRDLSCVPEDVVKRSMERDERNEVTRRIPRMD